MRYGFKLMSCKTGDHRSMIRLGQADSVGRAAAAAVEKKFFEKETIDRCFVVARLILLAERRRFVEEKFFRKRNDRSMIRRRRADSVGRAAAVCRRKNFWKKVEKFSKYFPSALED